MKVAIHQPYYLPWAGYFHKMSVVDKFVILDDVQFTRGQHFNRTKILVNGKPKWLTVPVEFRKGNSINETLISQCSQWVRKHGRTVDQNYISALHGEGVSAFFAWRFDYFSMLVHEAETISMFDNRWMWDIAFGMLSLRSEWVHSSFLDYEPATGTDRLVNICKALGADTYVSGVGGSKKYLELDKFKAAGIKVEWQIFEYKPYKQLRTDEFVPGLSIIDTLAALGPEGTKAYVQECGRLEEAI
jgi:hypothetical protein